tara:strand:- start:25 stop:339 length:315 start_codon:yes stop_codon:yes gene_type:complete
MLDTIIYYITEFFSLLVLILFWILAFFFLRGLAIHQRKRELKKEKEKMEWENIKHQRYMGRMDSGWGQFINIIVDIWEKIKMIVSGLIFILVLLAVLGPLFFGD